MNLIHRNKNPYKSTNIYRVTASLYSDFPTLTPFEKVERARKVIFTFDYPTPDNVAPGEFKQYFETMFITRFWERFFSADTFESFEMRFYSKMLEIMPVYSELLSIFFMENRDKLYLNYTKSETHSDSDSKTDGKESNNRNGSTNTTGTTKDINSVFPANMMQAGTHLDSVNYANNGNLNDVNNKQTTEDNSSGSHESNTKQNSNSYTESTSGVLLDGVMKFNSEFKTIFTNMLNEFSPLFTAIIDI